jgi:small-conductance mechanosensitive channel
LLRQLNVDFEKPTFFQIWTVKNHEQESANNEFLKNTRIPKHLQAELLKTLTHGEMILWADIPLYIPKHKNSLKKILVYIIISITVNIIFSVFSGVIVSLERAL